MSVSSRYLEYLQHFVRTSCLNQGSEGIDRQPGRILLRHDIDHDLDAALDLAAFEFRHGFESSYYVLHTAEYFDDSLLIRKLLQIQEYGHEIGLHINSLAQWWSGEIGDPGEELSRVLRSLRSEGLVIRGVSSHGDRRCYEGGFINYWCLRELKPLEPMAREDGLSAEGIPVLDSAFQISYPKEDALVSPDGRVLELWSTDMTLLGLDYEASHETYDRYFSDSGGSFLRTPDPLEEDLRMGTSQVLMHPIYWQDSPTHTFIFSTPRSGSTWLATQLGEGTTGRSFHEQTLNVDFVHGHQVARKRTGLGLADLLENPAEIGQLLSASWAIFDELSVDTYEANVYLWLVLDELAEVFQNARAVHLVRDPADVVSSLLDRGWYRVSSDSRYPPFRLPFWDRLDQFAKICWFVRLAFEQIETLKAPFVKLEQMVTSKDELADAMWHSGVIVHPLLLEDFHVVINARREYQANFAVEKWTPSMRVRFDSVCGSIQDRYGYSRVVTAASRYGPIEGPVRLARGALRTKQMVYVSDLADLNPIASGALLDGFTMVPDGDRHAHLLLGGPKWHEVEAQSGWEGATIEDFYGSVSIESRGATSARFLLLEYDRDRQLSRKTVLCDFAFTQASSFTFKLHPETRRFNLAIYSKLDEFQSEFTLRSLELYSRRAVRDGSV